MRIGIDPSGPRRSRVFGDCTTWSTKHRSLRHDCKHLQAFAVVSAALENETVGFTGGVRATANETVQIRGEVRTSANDAVLSRVRA